jgi:long-chain acyl-CoA synthetase
MMGYYKNEEATRLAIDADGWLHTGDMGIMDRDRNIFIKGRCKNMLLGPSGQNIYPEEIEDEVLSLPYVVESIVVQRDHKLYALVFPDHEAARHAGLTTPESIHAVWEAQRKTLNAKLPPYAQLSGFELQEKEFEKTPKKSIKRFLYQ